DDDMAFAAVDVLGVVAAALLASAGGVHRLAVDAGGGARGIGLLGGADFGAEQVVDDIEGAVVPPLVEVAPDGGLGREILGQGAPLAAGPQEVKDGIDDVAQVGGARSPAGVNGRVRLDQGPLRVGNIAGIGLRSHGSLYASSPLMGQSLTPFSTPAGQ